MYFSRSWLNFETSQGQKLNKNNRYVSETTGVFQSHSVLRRQYSGLTKSQVLEGMLSPRKNQMSTEPCRNRNPAFIQVHSWFGLKMVAPPLPTPGHVPPLKALRKNELCLFLTSDGDQFLGLQLYHSNLCLHCYTAFFVLHVSTSSDLSVFIRTRVIGIRVYINLV